MRRALGMWKRTECCLRSSLCMPFLGHLIAESVQDS